VWQCHDGVKVDASGKWLTLSFLVGQVDMGSAMGWRRAFGIGARHSWTR
jgi:hypothetical protein